MLLMKSSTVKINHFRVGCKYTWQIAVDSKFYETYTVCLFIRSYFIYEKRKLIVENALGAITVNIVKHVHYVTYIHHNHPVS